VPTQEEILKAAIEEQFGEGVIPDVEVKEDKEHKVDEL
jgi:cyanate lyase